MKTRLKKLRLIDYLMVVIALISIAILPILYIYVGIAAFFLILAFYYLINLVFLFDVWVRDRIMLEIRLFWTAAFFFLPFIGGMYYYKYEYITLKDKVAIYKTFEEIKQVENSDSEELKSDILNTQDVFETNLKKQGAKILTKTNAHLFENDQGFLKKLLNEIKDSKHTINMMFYNFSNSIYWKEVEKVLINKLEKKEINLNIIFEDRLTSSKANFSLFENYENVKILILNKGKYKLFDSGISTYYYNSNIVTIDDNIGFYGTFNFSKYDLNFEENTGFNYKSIFLIKGELIDELNNYFTRVYDFLISKVFDKKSKREIIEEEEESEETEVDNEIQENEEVIEKVKTEEKSLKSNDVIDIEEIKEESELKDKKTEEVVIPDSKIKYQFVNDGPQLRQAVFVDTLVKMISQSKKNIQIVTPVFLPCEKIFSELEEALFRDVKIEIISSDIDEIRRWKKAAKIYGKFAAYSGITFLYSKGTKIQSSYYIFDNEKILFGNVNLYYIHYFKRFLTFIVSTDQKLIKEVEKDFKKISQNSYLLELRKQKFGLISKTKFTFYKYFLPLF